MFWLILRTIANGHIVKEGIAKASGLDWMIVRPAAFIDGPATGVYQHGFMPDEKKPTLKISLADVAGFMLQ